MKWTQIIWDDSPGGNVEHVNEHGFTVEDVEHVLDQFESSSVSRSSGSPCVFGYTRDGRYITVIFEEIGDDIAFPVTAYEVPEP